jgi:hypothetical protein
MKTPPSSPEFAKFTSAIRDLLKVSPKEIRAREDEHKEAGKRIVKGSACLSLTHPSYSVARFLILC